MGYAVPILLLFMSLSKNSFLSLNLNGARAFLAVLVVLTVTRASASGDVPEIVPTQPVRAAVNTKRLSLEVAPTSGVTRDEAFMMAINVAAGTGRDIVMSRVAATGSMKPYFDENSMLLLEAAPFESLKIGDVVTYFHPDLKIVVAHRLVEKRGEKFWSRGDHNPGMDNVYVTRDNYQRRLVGVIYMDPTQRAAPAAPSTGLPMITKTTNTVVQKVTASPKSGKPTSTTPPR